MKQITLLNPVGFTIPNAQIDSAGFETPGVHYSIVTTTNLIEPKATSADWDKSKSIHSFNYESLKITL